MHLSSDVAHERLSQGNVEGVLSGHVTAMTRGKEGVTLWQAVESSKQPYENVAYQKDYFGLRVNLHCNVPVRIRLADNQLDL